jgi:hypothetical protein
MLPSAEELFSSLLAYLAICISSVIMLAKLKGSCNFSLPSGSVLAAFSSLSKDYSPLNEVRFGNSLSHWCSLSAIGIHPDQFFMVYLWCFPFCIYKSNSPLYTHSHHGITLSCQVHFAFINYLVASSCLIFFSSFIHTFHPSGSSCLSFFYVVLYPLFWHQ